MAIGLLRAGRLGALAAFLLLGALTQVPRDGILFSPAQQTLQYLFGALVALLLVMPAVFSPSHGREGVPGRILTTRVMAWTGLISYGIYLWHEPVISYAIREFWVGFGHPSTRLIEYLGIALGLTIPIAIASYVLVERPLLRFKEPRGSRRGPQSSVATPGLAPDPDPVPAAAEAAPGPTTRSTR